MSETTRQNEPFIIVRRESRFGKSRILIECPYCGAETWAYLWSLAGSGKRCGGCDAVHHMYAGSVRRRAVETPVEPDQREGERDESADRPGSR